MLRRLYALALSAYVLCASASTLSRQDRLSPLAAGYLERAKIMLTGGNYAGVIDQLKHLDTQNIALQPSEREDCAYLLALAMYQRGDSDCVDLLREFAEAYPASPRLFPHASRPPTISSFPIISTMHSLHTTTSTTPA